MLVVRKPEGPAWKSVLGAVVLFAPIDRSMLRQARREAMDALGRAEPGAAVENVDLEELGDAFSLALITAGAQDWRDVRVMADGDDIGAGEEMPFTPDNLAAALADPITFEAFDAAYVRPFVMLEREKAAPGNVSAASPSGIGQAATAEGDTASNPAAAIDAAASVLIGSIKQKRTPKRRSGRS